MILWPTLIKEEERLNLVTWAPPQSPALEDVLQRGQNKGVLAGYEPVSPTEVL